MQQMKTNKKQNYVITVYIVCDSLSARYTDIKPTCYGGRPVVPVP